MPLCIKEFHMLWSQDRWLPNRCGSLPTGFLHFEGQPGCFPRTPGQESLQHWCHPNWVGGWSYWSVPPACYSKTCANNFKVSACALIALWWQCLLVPWPHIYIHAYFTKYALPGQVGESQEDCNVGVRFCQNYSVVYAQCARLSPAQSCCTHHTLII